MSHVHRRLYGPFPPNTAIKDHAYALLHPLYSGVGDVSLDEENGYYDSNDNDFHDSHLPQPAEEYAADEINRKAVALFDFQPENDNEVALTEGQVIWILYRHGQGWLVAEDPETGENGLVPEEYVDIYNEEEDVPQQFLPQILQMNREDESEWVDTDYEDDHEDISELVQTMKGAALKE